MAARKNAAMPIHDLLTGRQRQPCPPGDNRYPIPAICWALRARRSRSGMRCSGCGPKRHRRRTPPQSRRLPAQRGEAGFGTVEACMTVIPSLPGQVCERRTRKTHRRGRLFHAAAPVLALLMRSLRPARPCPTRKGRVSGPSGPRSRNTHGMDRSKHIAKPHLVSACPRPPCPRPTWRAPPSTARASARLQTDRVPVEATGGPRRVRATFRSRQSAAPAIRSASDDDILFPAPASVTAACKLRASVRLNCLAPSSPGIPVRSAAARLRCADPAICHPSDPACRDRLRANSSCQSVGH
jgi:hypothetical protein